MTSFSAKVKVEEANLHRREVEAALLANVTIPTLMRSLYFLMGKICNAESCLDFHETMSDLSRQIFSMTEEESKDLLTFKVKCVDV